MSKTTKISIIISTLALLLLAILLFFSFQKTNKKSTPTPRSTLQKKPQEVKQTYKITKDEQEKIDGKTLWTFDNTIKTNLELENHIKEAINKKYKDFGRVLAVDEANSIIGKANTANIVYYRVTFINYFEIIKITLDGNNVTAIETYKTQFDLQKEVKPQDSRALPDGIDPLPNKTKKVR